MMITSISADELAFNEACVELELCKKSVGFPESWRFNVFPRADDIDKGCELAEEYSRCIENLKLACPEKAIDADAEKAALEFFCLPHG
ncbi:hypothetical protein ElyMa_005890300 [Elysia marginata]|uniref:Ferredoxin n=1 Tax=Elysia marginata TaxID=1093978 RepID=A0AAV4G3J2_9GAST|nr:hypothetical protein ElyMa_005890300 [Elysia marginata]